MIRCTRGVRVVFSEQECGLEYGVVAVAAAVAVAVAVVVVVRIRIQIRIRIILFWIIKYEYKFCHNDI